MYKFYRDQFNESENLLKEYETNLNKRNYFLENLNEPLKFFNNKIEENLKAKGKNSEVHNKYSKGGNNSLMNSREINISTEKQGSKQGNKTTGLNQGQSMQDDSNSQDNIVTPVRMLNNFNPPSVKEIQIADKLENLIKNTFSKIFLNYFFIFRQA